MPAEPSGEIEAIDAGALQALIGRADVTIIDTRLPFDYFGGRVPGSLNLPGMLVLEGIAELPKDGRLIFVSDSEGECAAFAAVARGLGFAHVAVLKGGLDSWYDADLPVETASDGTTPNARV